MVQNAKDTMQAGRHRKCLTLANTLVTKLTGVRNIQSYWVFEAGHVEGSVD